jgi:hypothetical protein
VSDERTFAFIRTALKSVWDLELLLLLHRDTETAWTREKIVRDLRGSDGVVSVALQSLRAARLIGEVAPNTYRYEPANDELRGLVNSISQIYADRPMAVIKAITEGPNDKLRAFSDAFKLRGE